MKMNYQHVVLVYKCEYMFALLLSNKPVLAAPVLLVHVFSWSCAFALKSSNSLT